METSPSTIEVCGTIFLFVAIIHTFLTSYFQRVANRYPSGSVLENLFHLLGEVEIVFGFWAAILLVCMLFFVGQADTLHFADNLSFAEPIFVFAIMTVASTRPIIETSQKLITHAAKLAPSNQQHVTYFLCLFIGPLTGSFITEPAAMTVTALVLYNQYYQKEISNRFRYLTIAVLFVNVSIGGVLTHYAAPPVLMVAEKWNWNSQFMFFTFGWKAMMAVAINTAIATAILAKELKSLPVHETKHGRAIPVWVVMLHIVFIAAIVLTSHHSTFCIGMLLFFLGVAKITSEYQHQLKIRQSLLVAFFLGGLVILGSFQSWWLTPLLHRFNEFSLFVAATIVTSFTDNAALTYLGSKVQDVTDGFKYALVAGAVCGGGLTVIANAPNPAGFSILQRSFGKDGIHPGKLFLYALFPTLISMMCFWLL